MAAFQRIIMFLIAIYAVLAVSAASPLAVRDNGVGSIVVVPPADTQTSPSSGGAIDDKRKRYENSIARFDVFKFPKIYPSAGGKDELRKQLQFAREFAQELQKDFLMLSPGPVNISP